MIRREGGRIVLSGAVTLANVAALRDEGTRHLQEGVRVVDLGEVIEMDSSLVALMLAWLRDARGRNTDLSFSNPPDSLRTIARLYGVEPLLPFSA